MGMFDTVKIHCPHCGSVEEVQSKDGPCELNEYELEEAPLSILGGIRRQRTCPSCGKGISIVVQTMVVVRGSFFPPKSREEEEDEWW